jgi:hypothetical protein
MTQEFIFEKSSDNVFTDLGLEDADELFARGQIRSRNVGDLSAETALL